MTTVNNKQKLVKEEFPGFFLFSVCFWPNITVVDLIIDSKNVI